MWTEEKTEMDVMEEGMTSAEVMKKGRRIETGGVKKKNYKEIA